MQNQQITNLPVQLIQPGNNDRQTFNEQALQELAASIQQHSLAQPITVRPIGDHFELVAGERRYRAIANILQWETIPAIIRELTDEEAAAIMLVENTSRVDLDPIAEANAYRVRIEKFGWTTAHIAEVAGVNTDRVRSRLKLLELVEDIQHYVRTGNFPIGHAQLLIDAKLDVNRQRIALRVFNSAASMPLLRFKDVVQRLAAEQAQESQLNMFELELKLMEEVQSDEPAALKGKMAKTGAPVNRKLPPVKVRMTDNVGEIMDRYIYELIQNGHADAAAALGNVYNTLVSFNWTSVPSGSLLAKTGDNEASAEENAHCQRI